jgi:hypothetical protein
MNFIGILARIASNSAARAFAAIYESPNETASIHDIVKAGMSRTMAWQAIGELQIGGFIIKIGGGVYRIADSAMPTPESAPPDSSGKVWESAPPDSLPQESAPPDSCPAQPPRKSRKKSAPPDDSSAPPDSCAPRNGGGQYGQGEHHDDKSG